MIGEIFDLAGDRAVDVYQSLHSGHQKRPGAARRVEYAEVGQDLVQQTAAQVGIQIHEHIRQRFVAFLRCKAGNVTLGIHLVEYDLMDGVLAEIFGDLGACVICAKGFLVDVFLEYIAQHVGVDLVVSSAGGVVEVPRIAVEQLQQIAKRLVGDVDVGVLLFDSVRQKQPAVQIDDLAEQFPSLRTALIRRLCEALEEQRVEQLFVEVVRAKLVLGLFELVVEIELVAPVQKELLLQEEDEHQAVHEDRRIPLPIRGVVDAVYKLDELASLVFELIVESFGDALDIQRTPHRLSHFEN